MLISKPSPHLWNAVKIGFSTLLAQLSAQIPAIIVRKLIGMACVHDFFDEVMSAYVCSFRYQLIILAVIIALSQGYIPAASYAYQAHRYKRFLLLTIHAAWTMLVWGTVCSIIMWIFPRQLASLFSKTENFLKYSEQQISIVNGFSFIIFGRIVSSSLLQAIVYAYTSMILSLINNLALIIVFALILYYTNKTDPIRITWCYAISYCAGLVLGIIFCAKPCWDIYKKAKTTYEPEFDQKKAITNENNNENNDIPEL